MNVGPNFKTKININMIVNSTLLAKFRSTRMKRGKDTHGLKSIK